MSSQAQAFGDWDTLPRLPDTVVIGSALTYGRYEGQWGTLYILLPQPTGAQENRLYKYELGIQPPNNRWVQLPNLPLPLAGYGANLCYFYDNRVNNKGYLFCTKGNSTNEFWQYDIICHQWTQLENIPGPVYQGRGMALETGDTSRNIQQAYANIYLLKGANFNGGNSEFYVYHKYLLTEPQAQGNPQQFVTWEQKDTLWHGRAAELTYVPSQKALYAFRGVAYYEASFVKYDIALDDWSAQANYEPLAGEGSCLATWGVYGHELMPGTRDTVFYALKGAYDDRFDKYSTVRTRWYSSPTDAPKDVYYGSDLTFGMMAYGGSLIYAIFGQGYPDEPNLHVWFFNPWGYASGGEQAVSVNPVEQEIVKISPNPVTDKIVFKLLAPITNTSNIKIFNNTGKLIHRMTIPIGVREVVWNIELDEGETPTSGIYFYVVKTGNKETFGKFIVQR
jgi:hypothetical protein